MVVRDIPHAIRLATGASSSEEALLTAESPTTATTAGTPLMTPMDGSVSELPTSEDGVKLDVFPLPSHGGVLIKVQPPRQPSNTSPNYHVPCDIVLVIDVSMSMAEAAPAPMEEGGSAEETWLSVLDLVKHASHTIIETLDKDDRLGIVTFSNEAKTLQDLTDMTDEGKKSARNNISSMCPDASTNMLQGILKGRQIFENTQRDGRVPVLMVLTDGVPNHGNPQEGWIRKLRSKGEFPVPINTFGFGFSLKSGLLQSISELTGGEYAFMPDSSMLATVFIHAVANLQSTFAKKAVLTLDCPSWLQLEVTTGESFGQSNSTEGQGLTVNLGSVHYGQSRDVFVRYRMATADSGGNQPPGQAYVEATLRYQDRADKKHTVTAPRTFLFGQSPTALPAEEAAYHVSRSLLCEFFSSLFPIRPSIHEHVARSWAELEEFREALERLSPTLPARAFPDDANCKSLILDLEGPAPAGQMSLAVKTQFYWERWGRHYLPSIVHAHSRQVCNSFKDEGPLRYGDDSPLYKRCRDRLYDAFDRIPEPPPSRRPPQLYPQHMTLGQRRYGSPPPPSYRSARRQMMSASFLNRDNPCFSASTTVMLAGDGANRDKPLVPISSLRTGMMVQTPLGPRAVAAVLKTRVRRQPMCRLTRTVLVTPWHPVLAASGDWVFPAELDEASLVHYTGCIYSVLLVPDPQPDAHAILVGGRMWGVTLGHGLVSDKKKTEVVDVVGETKAFLAAEGVGSVYNQGDARVHDFFGCYGLVATAMASLGVGPGGVVLCGGLRRDRPGGKVIGFRRPVGAGRGRRRGSTDGGRRAAGQRRVKVVISRHISIS